MSKKIYLNKSDSTASAIDKILKADDDEVILYIPREAEVAESKKDLELLQREVEAAGKTFKVESVDDDTIEKVLSLGIDATNPFLGRGKKTVSDIVVQRGRIPVRVSAPRKASKPGRAKSGRSVVGLGLTDDTGEETEMGTYKAPREGMIKGKKIKEKMDDRLNIIKKDLLKAFSRLAASPDDIEAKNKLISYVGEKSTDDYLYWLMLEQQRIEKPAAN